MFGKNKIMKIEHEAAGTLLVHSIFDTIQGEGPLAGLPAIFVRLGGCSLACSWCDTDFDENKSQRYSPEELVDEVHSIAMHFKVPTDLCVITGGEPMRQNLVPFIRAMHVSDHPMHVQIETAGIHWIAGLEDLIKEGMLSIVCSPKTSKLDENIEHYASSFKFIIGANDIINVETGLPACAVSQRGVANPNPLWNPKERSKGQDIYIQPLDDDNKDANVARCIALVKEYGHFLSLQTHKMIGLP